MARVAGGELDNSLCETLQVPYTHCILPSVRQQIVCYFGPFRSLI